MPLPPAFIRTFEQPPTVAPRPVVNSSTLIYCDEGELPVASSGAYYSWFRLEPFTIELAERSTVYVHTDFHFNMFLDVGTYRINALDYLDPAGQEGNQRYPVSIETFAVTESLEYFKTVPWSAVVTRDAGPFPVTPVAGLSVAGLSGTITTAVLRQHTTVIVGSDTGSECVTWMIET